LHGTLQRFARLVNEFCGEHLNPYINFHRPCLYAETLTDPTGRQHKRYPYELMMTPYEKFKSLPQAAKYLKHGMSFQQLDVFANSISDNDAAKHLNEARSSYLKPFRVDRYQPPEPRKTAPLRLIPGLENT
jgi:hypothetical protein